MFRNRFAIGLSGGALLTFTCAFVASAVQALDATERVVMTTIAGGGAVVFCRILRSGIAFRGEMVEVRGWLHTRRVAYSEVESIVTPPASLSASAVYIALRLRNGETLKTAGLTSTKGGEFELATVAVLEGILSRPSA